MSRLPCLRYKISDSTLFRTGLDYMPFYKKHPMTGPSYGDFHIKQQWTGAQSKFLCLGQLGSSSFQVEVEEFVPPDDQSDVDLKGRPIYAVPWAISDPDTAMAAMNEYIDNNIGNYMEAYLDDSDTLVWDIFHAAYRASVFPIPVGDHFVLRKKRVAHRFIYLQNPMLQKAIRLWVVCRFIESRWRCWGDDAIAAANPQDPFYDWESPPPYLDYQFTSIVIHRILGPLREEVLRDLQNIVNEHRPQDWYITFLTSFILLQNYEIQMLFQRQFAARRNAKVRKGDGGRDVCAFMRRQLTEEKVQYLDMALVRATNSGAKTILAHFHYCCKGQHPFLEKFDWEAARTRRMARLDAEQSSFMAAYRDRVIRKGRSILSISTGKCKCHRLEANFRLTPS
jgi:hypothetical protein